MQRVRPDKILPPGLAAMLGALAIGATGAPSAPPATTCHTSARVTLGVADDGVRLESRDAPLDEALAALAGCAGARLEIRGSLSGEVAGSVAATDLPSLLARLLESGGHSSVVVFDRGGERPRMARILVLASAPGPTSTIIPPAAEPAADPRRVQARRRDIAMAVRRKDASSQRVLVSLLRDDPDPQVREAAAAGLAQVGDVGLVAAIAQAAEDEPVDAVRYQAIRALGAIDDPSAGRVLADLLTADPDPLARRMAARALVRISGPEARQALERAARTDPEAVVREAAEKMLVELERAGDRRSR